MGLTNAERQKRHRERVKEALRNGTAHEGRPALTLPAALAAREARIPDEDRGGPVEDTVGGYMLDAFRALDVFPPDIDDLAPEVLTVFGGADYVRALHDWRGRLEVYRRKRRKDPAEAPLAPPLPVT